MTSECCGAKIYMGSDICSECGEHTGQDNNKWDKPKPKIVGKFKTYIKNGEKK
jgi:hypothetical protein